MTERTPQAPTPGPSPAQRIQGSPDREHRAALAGSLAAALPGAATNLGGDSDFPALAAAMTRAQSAGYDLDVHLPSLIAQAPLPACHPLRELHYRLLIDCPAALPAAGSTPRPLPPGYRVDEAGVADHAFYLVTTRGGQIVGAGHDRGQAEHLAHTHAAARSRQPTPTPMAPLTPARIRPAR